MSQYCYQRDVLKRSIPHDKIERLDLSRRSSNMWWIFVDANKQKKKQFITTDLFIYSGPPNIQRGLIKKRVGNFNLKIKEAGGGGGDV